MDLYNPKAKTTFTVPMDVPSAEKRRALAEIEERRIAGLAELAATYADIYELRGLPDEERNARLNSTKDLASRSITYSHRVQAINDTAILEIARASVREWAIEKEELALVSLPVTDPFWTRFQDLAALEVDALTFRRLCRKGRSGDPADSGVANPVPQADPQNGTGAGGVGGGEETTDEVGTGGNAG